MTLLWLVVSNGECPRPPGASSGAHQQKVITFRRIFGAQHRDRLALFGPARDNGGIPVGLHILPGLFGQRIIDQHDRLRGRWCAARAISDAGRGAQARVVQPRGNEHQQADQDQGGNARKHNGPFAHFVHGSIVAQVTRFGIRQMVDVVRVYA